jgi:hypothetical protein
MRAVQLPHGEQVPVRLRGKPSWLIGKTPAHPLALLPELLREVELPAG